MMPLLTSTIASTGSSRPESSSTARFLADHPDVPLAEQIEVLLLDQLLRWRDGCPKPVEEYLAEYVTLTGEPDARLKLIQESSCRDWNGTRTPNCTLTRKFPELAEEIRTQCEVDLWLTLPGEPESGPLLATTLKYAGCEEPGRSPGPSIRMPPC